jgi:cobalt-zinc-cadmium efflux system outer membrane protein
MRQWIYLALVFTAIPAAHAMEAPASGSITLDQVIVNVLERNPQLGVNDYEARAAAARIRQVQQGVPLEMKLDLQNFAGNGAYGGADRLETTLSLAKVLELGGKASSRGDLARQQANLLRNEQDSKRLDLLARAAEQFMHVVVDQHRLRIVQEQLELVKRTHDIVAQRVKAGRSHIAEQRRVAISLTRAEIELEHAEHELASSRLKLATTWGETKPQFGSAKAELFVLPTVQPFDQLETLLANNPDLIRFATEERVAQARLRLAQARRTPNLELSGGIRYFNEQKDGALVLSASIPFGSDSRARPHMEEMQYLAQREPLRYEQQRLALHSSLYAIYQELLHAQTAFEALSQRMIPEAERAVDDYEQGYKSGRFSLLELNETQRTLLDARLESVMAAANYHRFRIEIERLTGAALRSGVNP